MNGPGDHFHSHIFTQNTNLDTALKLGATHIPLCQINIPPIENELIQGLQKYMDYINTMNHN